MLFSSHAAFAGLAASVTVPTGQPTLIYPSEVTILRITVSNNNPTAPITGLAFSNTLPGTFTNGLRISGTPTYTCTDNALGTTTAGLGVLTAADNTQNIQLAGGVIPPRDNAGGVDGVCVIDLPVTAFTTTGGGATYTYTILSGDVTGNDGAGQSNGGNVAQGINVRALTQPAITKAFSNNTAILGGASRTLTITVTNNNAVALPNFSVTDNFPQLAAVGIIKVANPVVSTSTCTGTGTPATFAPVADATSVTATGGTVAANRSCTMTVAIVANHTNGLYETGLLNNTINGTSNFSNDIGITATNGTAQIRARSPLNVSKAFGSGSVASGSAATFTVTLSNTSPNSLDITSFTDDPVDGIGNAAYGLKVNAVPVVNCTVGGTPGTYAITAGNTGIQQTATTMIAGNGSCTIDVGVDATVQNPNTPITYTNTIPANTVTSSTPGVVSQSASAGILVFDDLRVLKAISPATAGPGEPVRYTVTVQNYLASALPDLFVQETLSNGQTFLTGTIGANNYTPSISGNCSGLSVTGATGATNPRFDLSLNARSSPTTHAACDIVFWAQTDAAGANGSPYGNTLAAGSVCYSSGTVCNGGASNSVGGSVSTVVISAAKAFSPAGPLSEGSITRLTVTLSNLSANPLTAVTLSDNLPVAGSGGQMRVASPPNAATTCGAGVITAVAGGTSFSMNSATVPARAGSGTGANGTCVVQFDVTGAAGVYSNTAVTAGTHANADSSTTGVGPVNSNAAPFTFLSSLGATKSFSPASVSSGGQATVTVRLNNAGAVALTNVGLTDPLPAGMVLANPVNAYSTCAGAPSFPSAVAGAGTISYTGAALAGGGNCDVIFDVVATGAANWVNTIPIGNITANGGVNNQTAVSGTLVFTAPTNLVVAKATNPSTLTFPGEISRLTIDITNGNLAVTGLDLADYFTADGTSGAAVNGMAVAPTPAAATTCPGGTVAAAAGATSIALNNANLAANASCTVSVNVTSTTVGGITNFIPPGSIRDDQGLTNSGQATTSLTTQSNIGVLKQFTPNVLTPGQRSRLRITFYNPTAQPTANLSVTDNLPVGVTIPAGPNATSTCSGATVTAPTTSQVQVSGANIVAATGGVAASCYAEIDVTATAEGDYINTIPASAITATVGGAPATNSQPTSDTLRAKAAVEIHKAFTNFTLDAGSPVGFTTGAATASPGAASVMTIRITNPNTAPLTAAALTDALPTGLVVATTPVAATTCAGGTVTAAASATSIRLTGATLGAGGTCNVTVNVLSNISGTYINTIPASALTTFEGVSNEEPTAAQITISTPPVVSKQFAPAVIPSGGTSVMTIFLGNDNDVPLTLTSIFTDNLPTAPGPLVVAGTPGVVKTCPGAVTAVAGSATVSYANGATIPVDGCTISVNVTATVPGVHTNNIPAGRLQTNLGNSQDPANATLTVSSLGYIAGRVFQDGEVTPNGIFNPGTDTPISSTSVELHSGATCGGALVDTQMTDSLGNYLFSTLAAGTYSVCEPVQPVGTSNGITTAGTITANNGSTGTAGAASNPTATTSQITSITLNGDGGGGEISGSNNSNFAEIVLSSISGIVFRDVNNNGVQNGPDAGINVVTIELLDGGGTVINTTTTNGAGAYSFTNLAPGTYSVREPTQPAGTSNGITTPGSVPNGGTTGTATTPATLPSAISNIILPPGTYSTANNFAEIPNGRSISGNVFLDYDNSGLANGPDHGIGGQTVNLTGTDINATPVNATTTTDVMGAYSFTGLPAGTYTVSQPAQPTGTTNGITTQGTTGGAPSNPTATTSQILNLDLTGANNVSAENNFAEIPGAAPDLTITKTHTPSGFGEGSDTGYFTITPANIGAADTAGVVTVVDTLPAGMTVAVPATGTGWACTGAVGASVVTCTTNDVIAAGTNGNDITLRVQIAPGLAGQLLVNNAVISGGGEPPGFDGNNNDDDTVAITATANVSGTIWRDYDHDRTIGGGEPRVPNWDVELLFNGVLIRTVQTAADGTYSFTALSPGDGYQIRFREPTTNEIYGRAVPNEQGITPANDVRDTGATTVNPGVNSGNPAGADVSSGDGTLRDITLLAGDNIIEQSLPLDPAGVVYDAITRVPVAGADVTITGPGGFNPAIHLVGGNATVTTAADGLYQFLLTAGAPAGDYTLTITTYPGGYLPLPSTLIPVCANPVVVSPAPPDPALVQTTPLAPNAATPLHNPAACPASSAAFTPGDQATTQHYFTFTINPATSANIVNNHIPLDPVLGGAIVLTKTTPMVNVSIGQLVPYIITLRNTLAAGLSNIDITDTLPPGFKFKAGSATIDNVTTVPTLVGRALTFPNLTVGAGATRTIKLLMVVGAGVQPGEYVNRAQAFNNLVVPPTPNAVSNIATATVRVIPDPVFDCSDLIGKVFDDENTNGYQDQGEPGIPAVRVATVNGLLVTTDADGRFHIACAAIPDADRGSNFILKLDERTLPTGYRVTTENPRIVRMTRGKMVKLNFGAAIHKVIRIDMRDAAFESGTTNLRAEWQQQIAALPEKLRDRPGVLRISYIAAGEGDKLARDRLQRVSKILRDAWKDKDCCHELQIEEELILPGKGK
ncbi:MAG: SdrD B-like domain-containing protein [bacterium]|nr:SdrD B-like domain-containing protein [bacterium]